MTWNDHFLSLFGRCVELYRAGTIDHHQHYDADDLRFLSDIGCQTREFFDFVEDHCEEGTPSPSTALLIASIRRDYLRAHPETATPCPLLNRDNIPTFGDELQGIPYLPRILAKARAKLRGQLDPDLMFGCGGDRRFLKQHGDIHPADFLRKVWETGDHDSQLADWLTRPSGK